jgi:hypothetical protein
MFFRDKMEYINFFFRQPKTKLFSWFDKCSDLKVTRKMSLKTRNCVVIRCSFVHCWAEPNPCKVRYGCQDNGPPRSSGQMPSHLRRANPRSCYTIVLFFAVTTGKLVQPFQPQRHLDNKNMKTAQKASNLFIVFLYLLLVLHILLSLRLSTFCLISFFFSRPLLTHFPLPVLLSLFFLQLEVFL